MSVYGRGSRGWTAPPKARAAAKPKQNVRVDLGQGYVAADVFRVVDVDHAFYVEGYLVNPGEVIELVPYRGVWMTREECERARKG